MKTNERIGASEFLRRCPHPGGAELTRRGLSLCGFAPGARLLDIGCGQGASVRLARDMGFFCVGADRAPCPDADIPRVAARAEALPFAPRSFDGLICECVLSLDSDPGRTLRGMRELLKPGGRLLYSDLYRAGAPQETEALLRAAGFGVRCFEDHARALKECAAQLVWRGGLETAGCEALRGLSYGLWVAEKE